MHKIFIYLLLQQLSKNLLSANHRFSFNKDIYLIIKIIFTLVIKTS